MLIQTTKVPLNFTAIKSEIQSIIETWKSNWTTDFMKRFPFDAKPNPVNMSADVLDASFSYMAVWKKNATVSYEIANNIAYFTLDSNFVAIRSIAQIAPTVTTATDNYGIKDTSNKGELCGLVLEVGSKRDYASLEAFKNAIQTKTLLDKSQVESGRVIYKNLEGEVISMQYNSSGTFTEPIYDWGYGPTTPQIAQKSPPFVQPQWPHGEGYGRVPTWSVNNVNVSASNLAVYKGKNFELSNRILRIYAGKSDSLRVDFSGNLPVYSTTISDIFPVAINRNGNIELYPNPAKELVNVEVNSSYIGSITIELIDLMGRSIYLFTDDKKFNKQIYTIPLSKKHSGIYFVKFKEGQYVLTRKMQIY